jgi:hypothetical protein
MAQSKAELEYDKYQTLHAGHPRPVDADFEQAIKQLPQAPTPKPQRKKK